MRAAVIGAGIAGSRIASRLRTAGAKVEIFEKARGPSGRTSTRRSDTGQFDHGAQYFTARSPAFGRQTADWLDRGVAARWDACICEIEDGIAMPEREAVIRYVGQPRMSVLARDLAGDVPLHASVRIERVEPEGGGWTLRSEAGACFGGFDAVVVATPAPQSVPLLEAAPELARAAGSVGMLPCHAVMLRFAEPLSVPFDGAFVRSSPIAWIARNDSKPHRADETCWVLHSDPGWSRENLEVAPEKISAELIRAFVDALSLAKPLPEVSSSAVHLWRYARPVPLDGSGPRWDAGRRLGICGDWVRGARVEDAFLSADELFERIAVESSD